MHHRVDFLRLSLFAALGLCPNACASHALENGNATAKVEGPTNTNNSGPGQDSSPPTGEGPSSCGQSTPILTGTTTTGIEECGGNGLRHRPSTDVQCNSVLPRPDVWPTEGTLSAACTSDADCTALPHGFCGYDGGQAPMLVCTYGCLTDADCGANRLCECGDPVGRCIDADCKADSDCGEGHLCAYWGETTGIGCPVTPHYVCQTDEDECAVDGDCSQDGFGMRCSAEGGTRKCVEIEGVACGRPFLVEGAERVAALVYGSADAVPGPIGSGLSEGARAAIGAHWARVGLMEHASIAAFARFALQLMHLGAPHALLVSAQQAMWDETNHAQLCFDVASRVLGRTVGAGKLAMEQALSEVSLEDIVRLTIREGCIGETVAAMEASEAATLAKDPHIQGLLQRIATDELRHSELAWRFVQWALEQDARAEHPSLHAVVSEELEIAKRGVVARGQLEALSCSEHADYGVVSPATHQELRREAILNVVVPCAAELLRVATFELESRLTSQATRREPVAAHV